MKKLICLFCAFCSVFALAACGDQGGDQQGEQEVVTQKYVSRFDCYEDMVICSLDYYYWSQSGAAEFALNTEKDFIREGEGSMKVHVLTPSRFLTSIEANNFRADNTKINGAKTISIDVYNPTESPVEFQLSVNGYSRTVLGAGNEITASFAPEVRGDCWMFRRGGPVDRGVWCDEESIYVGQEKLMPISQIKIPGWHNVENYMAAIAAVWGDVDPEVIRQVAATFNGVEHRAELVRELRGVKYYNDSIATSPTRVISGMLSLFPQKILMIAGGYDKHIPFEPLGPVVCDKVKTLILLGATAQKIQDAVQSAENYKEGAPEILRVETMEQAVAAAAAHAQPGDIVSLSPASAAFDLYPNFEVRGKHYKELVNGLE